jgi:hypothetical protein
MKDKIADNLRSSLDIQSRARALNIWGPYHHLDFNATPSYRHPTLAVRGEEPKATTGPPDSKTTPPLQVRNNTLASLLPDQHGSRFSPEDTRTRWRGLGSTYVNASMDGDNIRGVVITNIAHEFPLVVILFVYLDFPKFSIRLTILFILTCYYFVTPSIS